MALGEGQNKRLELAILMVNVLCIAVPGVAGDTRLLMNHVLKNYHKGVRPVVDENTTIHVSHEVVPYHIISFDEVIQKLKISVWIRTAWNDEFLTWNPNDFNGTESFHLAGSLLWKPDIILYQNVDESSSYNEEKPYPAKVSYNGHVSYDVPGIMHVYCRVDLTHYPFDTQYCQLMFSSWTHHVRQINLTSRVTDGELNEYQHDGEWDLLQMKVDRNLVFYVCCPFDPISDVTYTLVLRRKPDFYVTNIIIPYVLLSCLSVLVFYLPSESGEKVTLSVTTLLSLIVFNQLVTTTIPPASDTFPIVGKYFIVMVGVVASTVAASVLVMATYHHHSSGLPINPVIRWIIFDILACMVGKRCRSSSCSETRPMPSKISDSEGIIPRFRPSRKGEAHQATQHGNAYTAQRKGIRYLSEVLAYDNSSGFPIVNEIQFGTSLPMPEMTELGPENKSRMTLRMEKEMSEVSRRIRYLTLLKESKETHRYISKQWKEAAVILDRVFFWFFTILIAILPTIFLMKTKQMM